MFDSHRPLHSPAKLANAANVASSLAHELLLSGRLQP